MTEGKPLVDVFAEEEVLQVRLEVYNLIERCYKEDSGTNSDEHIWVRALPRSLRPWVIVRTPLGVCKCIHGE